MIRHLTFFYYEMSVHNNRIINKGCKNRIRKIKQFKYSALFMRYKYNYILYSMQHMFNVP